MGGRAHQTAALLQLRDVRLQSPSVKYFVASEAAASTSRLHAA